MTEKMWAGKRLGLPEAGRGSLAKFPRRVVALCIDWAISLLVSSAFFNGDNLATLAIFALMQWLLVATSGSSFGHLVCGLKVQKLNGHYVGFLASALRIAMILLVIPATIWDNDNRGLHDKLGKTVLVRR